MAITTGLRGLSSFPLPVLEEFVMCFSVCVYAYSYLHNSVQLLIILNLSC